MASASSDLFVKSDGGPQMFSMRYCCDFDDVREVIERHGGRLVGTMMSQTIRLVPEEDGDFCVKGHRFKAQYIFDCDAQDRLLPLGPYQLMNSQHKNKCVDPMDVLLGCKTWDDCICFQESSDNHSSGDELFMVDQETSRLSSSSELATSKAASKRAQTSKESCSEKKSNRKGKASYTHKERMSMLNYIIENRAVDEVKGNQLWKTMEAHQVCNRSYQSMKEHFRKYIIQNLKEFNIPFKIKRQLFSKYASKEDVDAMYEEHLREESHNQRVKERQEKKDKQQEKNEKTAAENDKQVENELKERENEKEKSMVIEIRSDNKEQETQVQDSEVLPQYDVQENSMNILEYHYTRTEQTTEEEEQEEETQTQYSENLSQCNPQDNSLNLLEFHFSRKEQYKDQEMDDKRIDQEEQEKDNEKTIPKEQEKDCKRKDPKDQENDNTRKDLKEQEKVNTRKDLKEQEKDITRKNPEDQEKDNTRKDPKEQEKDNTRKDPKELEKDITRKDPEEQEKDNTRKDPKEQEKDNTRKNPKEQEKDNTRKDPKQPEKDNTRKDPKQQEKDNARKDPEEQEKDNTRKDPKEQEKDNARKDPKEQEKDNVRENPMEQEKEKEDKQDTQNSRGGEDSPQLTAENYSQPPHSQSNLQVLDEHQESGSLQETFLEFESQSNLDQPPLPEKIETNSGNIQTFTQGFDITDCSKELDTAVQPQILTQGFDIPDDSTELEMAAHQSTQKSQSRRVGASQNSAAATEKILSENNTENDKVDDIQKGGKAGTNESISDEDVFTEEFYENASKKLKKAVSNETVVDSDNPEDSDASSQRTSVVVGSVCEFRRVRATEEMAKASTKQNSPIKNNAGIASDTTTSAELNTDDFYTCPETADRNTQSPNAHLFKIPNEGTISDLLSDHESETEQEEGSQSVELFSLHSDLDNLDTMSDKETVTPSGKSGRESIVSNKGSSAHASSAMDVTRGADPAPKPRSATNADLFTSISTSPYFELNPEDRQGRNVRDNHYKKNNETSKISNYQSRSYCNSSSESEQVIVRYAPSSSKNQILKAIQQPNRLLSDMESGDSSCEPESSPRKRKHQDVCEEVLESEESLQDIQDSSDESEGPARRTPPQHRPSVYPSKKKRLNGNINYTVDEDIAILKFIERRNMHHKVRGNKMWQDMEFYMQKRLPGRGWQSMKERFVKRILPRIGEYIQHGLPKEALRRFHVLDASPNGEDDHAERVPRRKYTYDDDKLMVTYILQHKRWHDVGGRNLWQTMAKNVPRLKGRTWSSMWERYRRHIRPNLQLYELTENEMEKLANPRSKY